MKPDKGNNAITLQINTSGAWKNMLTFAPERREEVLRAVGTLAGVLGSGTTWCLLHPDGKREWLREPLSQWRPVTDEQPAPLDDVMVSVFGPGDDAPVVFMAYRRKTGDREFVLSGTCDEVIRGVYAFAPIMGPAPAPAAQQVAA